MIEEVEELRPELRVDALCERDFLHQGHIPVVQPRDLHDVTAGSSERADRRRHEASGIGIAIDGAITVRKISIAARHGDVGALKRIAAGSIAKTTLQTTGMFYGFYERAYL